MHHCNKKMLNTYHIFSFDGVIFFSDMLYQLVQMHFTEGL